MVERRGQARREKVRGVEDERTVEAISRGEAMRCVAMRCKAVSWCPVYGLNSTPGRPEGKDEEREVRTVKTLGSYLGAQAIVQKRRFARIEIQWKDWTATGGVVW